MNQVWGRKDLWNMILFLSSSLDLGSWRFEQAVDQKKRCFTNASKWGITIVKMGSNECINNSFQFLAERNGLILELLLNKQDWSLM